MRHYFLESAWVALRRPAALLLPIFAIVQSQHTVMHFLEAAVIHQQHHHMMRKWLGKPMLSHHELLKGELCHFQQLQMSCTATVGHVDHCKLQASLSILRAQM